MSLRLTPINDRVLVKPDEVAAVSKGGIIIPDVGQEKPTLGTVMAAGPGEIKDGYLRPMSVKEGDRVVYGKYAAGELKIDGETIAVLRQEQILGILTEVP